MSGELCNNRDGEEGYLESLEGYVEIRWIMSALLLDVGN